MFIFGQKAIQLIHFLDIDYFDFLEQDIKTYSELGSVYVTGDLNSRIVLYNPTKHLL